MRHLPHNPAATAFAPDALPTEVRASAWLTLSLLVVLMVAKSVAHLTYVGPACLTFAAFWQLRAPLWRAERQGMGLDAVGLHLGAWRLDLRLAATLALVVLPLYAAGYHAWVCLAPKLLRSVAAQAISPKWAMHAAWHMPSSWGAWLDAAAWFGERTLTHTLGVALPEEMFYRGYLQPLWQSFWPARRTIFGASFGGASVAACAVFALGHVVGEWHLGRLGPFVPGLLFAWQRARSGTIVGAVGLHAACNLFAEVWIRQYAPGGDGL